MDRNWEDGEIELRHEIDQLNQRIQELELHIQSREGGFDESKLFIQSNPVQHDSKKSLSNLLAAGLFPIVAGILGRIYRLIFRLK